MAVDLAKIKVKLNQFRQLEDNWDLCGSKAISEEVCETAFRILSAVVRFDTSTPEVIPCTDNIVQFEWHLKGIDLEVGVSEHAVDLYYVCDGKEEGFEVSLHEGIIKLCHLMDKIAVREA